MKIIADAVSLFLNGQQILHDINLQIPEQDFVGIIGPNGSGKSSFLKCLYRVQKPSAGKLLLNDRLLDEMSFRESALQMAVVAQHNFYSFDFSVGEIVLMGRSPHKSLLQGDTPQDHELVNNALRQVGLAGLQKRLFSTLSGGEQQRVILARALVQRTDCLILDEPTNHLDINYQLQLMDLVKNLGITVVAAIHDLNIAAMYCEHLIALQNGQIVGCGTPAELLTPEFIHRLYGVRAKINRNGSHLQISYLPQHWQ